MHQFVSISCPCTINTDHFKMYKLVVLFCLVAASSAQYFSTFGAPLAYGAPYIAPYSSNYRGPLSLAPGQPANVLGADGRPLDTLEVNLDKSAHLTAKAFDGAGIHLLKKRSAPFFAAPLTRIAYPAAPVLHSAPLTYAAPIASYPHIAPISYSTPYLHY